MSEYAGWIDGGATGAEALGKVFNKFFSRGSAIILNPASHQVTERGAGQNMSVDIAPGAGISALADYSIPVWSNATLNKTVTAADPTNPRNDIVVRYVSLSSFGPTNNLGALKFIIVSGTPAGSPSDPSDATIQAAVGAGNPWEKLARITLPANATTVVNAYITDLRAPVAFAGRLWGGASNTIGHSVPNVADDIVALLSASQSLSHKTITDPTNTISAVTFSNPYKFSAYRNASLSLTNTAWNLVAMDTKLFDTSTNVDVVTNKGRFTAPVAGFYQFNLSAGIASLADGNLMSVALYKNGVQFIVGDQGQDRNSVSAVGSVAALLQLAANDYIEPYIYNGGTGLSLYNGATVNMFSGFLVSAT
jgi:hypothetical protein